jgi:HPt (histidine-containing phosphotransfer) domain-containing protein
MRSLYLRTAKEFVKFMDTAIPELQQCLSAGDNQEATMRLHSLKGNAGTLGATELAIQAAILEKLCNTVEGMQECKAGLSQFELVVRATQVKMREAITLLGPEPVTTKSTTGGENSGPVNDADLEALKGIAALARASDMSVLQAFAEARELMEQLPAESVAALDSALQSLDLDTVATVCDQMLLSVSDRG